MIFTNQQVLVQINRVFLTLLIQLNKMEIHNIGVFCGSSMGDHAIYRQMAENLGKEIAQAGITLVYGGSNLGTMKALADACLKESGKVIGIMPRFLARKEILHQGLTQVYTCESMAERKELMGKLSDAFIALPGGIGTLDELFESLSWLQLDIYNKPIGILNVNHYYDPLLTFLDHATDAGFIIEQHRENLIVANDASDMLIKIRQFVPHSPPATWIKQLIDDTQVKLTDHL
ncbi:MAG TPA: TIGR00730 family Rossman fold protein [Bacteroidales bacterium]|nr:TIGR00730 family Rossman fold protein [Bacteroidales bacterium]MDI9573903.1 TIGR00730 family Rossman fold protein [Bacteroidota bacterium]OQC60948.1 MAG: LOG family protein ORF6 in fasciation locus [Bacteroidetes bacterium ADurb.Bin012]MBP9512020.1 TIGR00730 family Rossman fold protein [Bacteroidales bacterium]MBP9588500.1 TIGR00730 family Rossman fold protein [Bacteroidales bacterium]